MTTKDLYNSPISYVCDRAGRLQFPLPVGECRIGAWVAGDGVASVVVRSPRGEEGVAIDPLVIKLSATHTLRGIVVDADGKPIAGAVVHQWNRALCEDRELAELTFFGKARSEPTGEDGRFELVLPLDDAAFHVRAFVPVGEKWTTSDEVAVAAGGDDVVIRCAVQR